jgi:NAD(P)-dependent dehydrogenase (short-subunit alcohol dehydrogenase family)
MKYVLITGANRGLGLGLVSSYLQRGEHVFAGCRNPEEANKLHDLQDENQDLLSLVRMDVTDESSLEAAYQVVRKETSHLDILYNNAAINLGDETILTVQADHLLSTLQVNAVSAVLVAKHLLPLLQASEQPKLVNISSEAGSITRMNSPRGYAYYASKAAMNMFTRSLSLDPNLAGIIVVSIHPGWVRTDMGGPNATLSPAESTRGIVSVVDRLAWRDTGKFFTYTGEEYPW